MDILQNSQNLEEMDLYNTGQLSKGDVCRICFSREASDNPFAKKICVCCDHNKIHVKCLILWMRSRSMIEKVPNQVFFIDWKTIKCELCNSWYPMEVDLNGKKVPIFQPVYDFNCYFFTLVVYSLSKKELTGIFYVIP